MIYAEHVVEAVIFIGLLAVQVVLSVDYGVYVVIRMDDDKASEYSEDVIEAKKPQDNDGKVQTLAKSDVIATLQGNAWASGTLSVVYFPDTTKAEAWMASANPAVNQTNWMSNADVIIQPLTEELPNKDQKAMLMMVPVETLDVTAFFNKTMPWLMKQVDDNDGEGGATGDTTNKWTRVKGDWPANNTYVQIIHMPSLDKARTFWNTDIQEGVLNYTDMAVFATERAVDLQEDDDTSTAPGTNCLSLPTFTLVTIITCILY